MNSFHSVPCEEYAPDGEQSWMLEKEERVKLFHSLMLDITENVFMYNFKQPGTAETPHKVNLYAKLLLNWGLFYLEFSDAIKKGDGSRVLRCYRYMLPMFISSACNNYSIKCMHLLIRMTIYCLRGKQ